ncbi:OsmC family protein [Enterococcus dongliensis]|uniref:OsmC family protein n=1 Tax=Enterococcus dongliensis TaxID=2559925 RepID=A0AAW8THP9_9ENTE|nr:OsmC family protein [Enterococcus dongliensis]MDT2597293.1 OsmC family protein [Enterococcus dongliensis]MDT2604429.1 OsmC family protein [Enterococcus dongliensis]MDT2635162.1 OsmC family protein [Enterococcus dongliensis]MDT2637834.1 OsmC family protein [Enterococcus dongliensis]MDT2643522.1 OsmC family protein [Enterococcus dongliensis]
MVKQLLKAEVESLGGLQLKCSARGFEFMIDEPISSGGTNEAMNPLEALLCSLGACKMMVARFFYQSKHIDLKKMRVEVLGEIDSDRLKGKPNVKVGFSKIITNYYIEAENSPEEIQSFVTFIEKTCPVKDTIVNSPGMELHINP